MQSVVLGGGGGWGISHGHTHSVNRLWREGKCANDKTRGEKNQHELSTYCVPGGTLSVLCTQILIVVS